MLHHARSHARAVAARLGTCRGHHPGLEASRTYVAAVNVGREVWVRVAPAGRVAVGAEGTPRWPSSRTSALAVSIAKTAQARAATTASIEAPPADIDGDGRQELFIGAPRHQPPRSSSPAERRCVAPDSPSVLDRRHDDVMISPSLVWKILEDAHEQPASPANGRAHPDARPLRGLRHQGGSYR